MLLRIPKPGEIRESEATPECVWRDRRRILQSMGFGALALATGPLGVRAEGEPSGGSAAGAGYPAKRNPAYTLDRPLTDEVLAARSTIFDEMSSERDKVSAAASRFQLAPWTVQIGGHVKETRIFDVTDLIRRFGLEERLYRHRCVEAWAMAVPWTGFPLARLVELAGPLAKAKYVRVLSVARPEEMPAFYATRRVFPYYEALTLAEASHELAFVATGIYGHPLPAAHGAPLRLVLPWKYGFKSAKSVVAFEFLPERPGTFWSELSPDKYDFVANVDPTATKPWPQSHETMLGSDDPRPTLPYNGYGELVARLYS
jgi:sulfoxide reductase catalytic subunit YedY